MTFLLLLLVNARANSHLEALAKKIHVQVRERLTPIKTGFGLFPKCTQLNNLFY